MDAVASFVEVRRDGNWIALVYGMRARHGGELFLGQRIYRGVADQPVGLWLAGLLIRLRGPRFN